MNLKRLPLHGQLDLLGEAEKGRRDRVALDGASWVEHVSRWLSDDEEVMAALLETADWEQRSRWMYEKVVIEPRLTAEFPVLAEAPLARLREVGSLLSAQYGVPYHSAWLNLYRDHNDSTAWHSDTPCRRSECVVPVLSLGETRRFLIRPKAGGRSRTFTVKSGDLIVMGGRCQSDWVHSVPKEKGRADARISINFASALQAIPDDEEATNGQQRRTRSPTQQPGASRACSSQQRNGPPRDAGRQIVLFSP
jgi:alkylated DNA repair dioxygenase AlkB